MKQISGKLEIVQLAIQAVMDKIKRIMEMEAAMDNAHPGIDEDQIQQEKALLKEDINNIINGLTLIAKSID